MKKEYYLTKLSANDADLSELIDIIESHLNEDMHKTTKILFAPDARKQAYKMGIQLHAAWAEIPSIAYSNFRNDTEYKQFNQLVERINSDRCIIIGGNTLQDLQQQILKDRGIYQKAEGLERPGDLVYISDSLEKLL